MTRHVRVVHDKIKQFKCHLCQHEFSRKYSLRNHILAVHEKVKIHKCDGCDFEASSRNTIKRHQKEVHQMSTDIDNEVLTLKTEPMDSGSSQSESLILVTESNDVNDSQLSDDGEEDPLKIDNIKVENNDIEIVVKQEIIE